MLANEQAIRRLRQSAREIQAFDPLGLTSYDALRMAARNKRLTVIEERVHIDRSPLDVFAFFDRPRNVQRVTPKTIAVSLESHPEDLRLGTIFAYSLKRWPVDFAWDVVVSEYEPPLSFTNVKARGFFPRWAHRHAILPDGSGTELVVSLEYEVPSGLYNAVTNNYVIESAMKELVQEQCRAIAQTLEQQR